MCLNDKDAIKSAHRYEIRRILLEKVLLGIILSVSAFVAKIIIEDYRSNLTQERFLLESRLSAIKTIREAYSKLSLDFFYLANANESDRPKIVSYSKRDLDQFTNLSNNCLILFSRKCEKRIRFHYWVYQAPFHEQVRLTSEHLGFLEYISEDFDNLTRAALWEETLGRKSVEADPGIPFIDRKNSKDFFLANFSKWKNEYKEK